MKISIGKCLFLALLSSNVFAQNTVRAPDQSSAVSSRSSSKLAADADKNDAGASQESGAPSSAVAPNDPVITLHGLCREISDANRPTDKPCSTSISKREFELLENSINLNGKPTSPGARQNLAKAYAEYLVYEQPAIKAGLENTNQYAEIMRWLRLRMLTDLLREKIYKDNLQPSENEIAQYYDQHVPDFERAHIARVIVPRNVLLPDEQQFKEKPEERDRRLQDLANSARARLINGEEPELVEKDIYAKLGIGSVPPTDLGQQSRKDFLANEVDELFALKAGGISKVEQELASYVIYKVISRDTLSQDAVKAQISQTIARENIEKANHVITDSVAPEYNAKYFGPPAVDTSAASKSPHP